jgi:hypothetical protein
MISPFKVTSGTFAVLITASFLATGCVTQPSDKKPIAASDVCSVGRTLVCRKHHGKVYKCSCQSKDALRELLEPDLF